MEPDLFALRMMTPHGRVAVVVHLADLELWSGICRTLTNIPEAFDLFVTLTKGAAAGAAKQIHESFPAAQVLEFEPRGRDIDPWVALINSGVLFRYDVVCKLHANGEQWDQRLVGDPNHVRTILASFDADPDLGIVVAEYPVEQESLGDNDRNRLLQFCNQIGQHQTKAADHIRIAQSCWIRPFLLRMVDRLKLAVAAFESDPGEDFSASALERFLPIVCREFRYAHNGTECPRNPASQHVCSNWRATSQPYCFLFTAVPSDPGKRRLVGRRIYRVDQRHASQAAIQRAAAATLACRSRLLRSTLAGGQGRASSPRASVRPGRVLLLLLLVRRTKVIAAATGGSFDGWRTGLPLLAYVGERILDPSLGR